MIFGGLVASMRVTMSQQARRKNVEGETMDWNKWVSSAYEIVLVKFRKIGAKWA
jgi:hypothetical protein